MITELRRYRIRPESLESWLAFFADAARENERHGIRIDYAGVDRETSTFVWLRSFADEAARQAQKDAFYGSAWWLEREAFAMGHVVEYDVAFLDAAFVRDGGTLIKTDWPTPGDPAGTRVDGPPGGWSPSVRRTFVPSRTG